MKHLSAKEMRARGYLQEANRRFFHPLGLALEVHYADADPEATAKLSVQDHRDDPEGVYFAGRDSDVRRSKAAAVDAEWDAKTERREALGFMVQPVEDL